MIFRGLADLQRCLDQVLEVFFQCVVETFVLPAIGMDDVPISHLQALEGSFRIVGDDRYKEEACLSEERLSLKVHH